MGNLENEPRGIRSKCIERKINRKAEEEGDPRTSRIRRVSSDIGECNGEKLGNEDRKKLDTNLWKEWFIILFWNNSIPIVEKSIKK